MELLFQVGLGYSISYGVELQKGLELQHTYGVDLIQKYKSKIIQVLGNTHAQTCHDSERTERPFRLLV